MVTRDHISVSGLLQLADKNGVMVTLDGDNLRVKARQKSACDTILTSLKERKREIVAYLSSAKHIEYHEGVRVFVGYNESEYRDILKKEYPAIPLDILCDICHYNQATIIWKEGKHYCRDCREREACDHAGLARVDVVQHASSLQPPAASTSKKKQVDQAQRAHAILEEQEDSYFLYMEDASTPIVLPSTIEGFLPIFEEHHIHTLWVMPGCHFSRTITWAYIGAYNHAKYRVFPDKPMEDVREKKPSYIELRRETKGVHHREYYLAFPEHEQWLDSGKTWICPDAETLYQTVNYTECEYPRFAWSPQSIGKNLLRSIYKKEGWEIPETVLTPLLKNAIDHSVQRPTWIRDGGLSDEQKAMAWVIGGDKNGQYVGGTRSLELGTGQCVEVHASAFDRKTPGLWYAQILGVDDTIFNSYDLFCPWTQEKHWFSTDLLTACEKAGISFKIHEGLIWRQYGKYMDSWGKEIWQHRSAYNNLDRFPHDLARRNAAGTAKQAGNSFIGLVAHPKKTVGKGMIYRPDWNTLIIHKALANLIYSLKSRYDKHGVLPVLLARGDTQWIVSNEPTVPTLFDHAKEQRGWKPIGWPIPMSDEIVAMFETQDASMVADYLEKKATFSTLSRIEHPVSQTH